MRNIFGWSDTNPISFYITDFIFRKIFRQNAAISWPVHFTSTIRAGEKLIVGKNTFPGDSPNNYINATNGIEIGDNTNLGPNVSLISSNHDFYDNSVAPQAPPIKIGSNCWLGTNCVVLPGITLGNFTIVGAGAVVTKSFEGGYCILVGNPARIIKHLDKEQCTLALKNKANR